MDARLLGQPFGDESQLGEVLVSDLSDARHTELRIAVAWAKRSGLARIESALRAFRSRGGHAEAIIGLDEGGATWEGLELARDLFDQVYVFHDTGPRTFHPKLYLLEGELRAKAFVGSSNVTRGGLYTNYEANISLVLEKSDDDDLAVVRQIRTYYEALRDLSGACIILDSEVLARLREDNDLRIQSESESRGREGESSERTGGATVFGPPVRGLGNAPALRSQQQSGPTSSPTTPDSGPEDTEAADVAGVASFWKALSAFDVSLTSAPGQMIVPIRFLDFFGAMIVQRDERESGGIRQSDIEMPLDFIDNSFRKHIPNARAILYEPAEHHPRPNKELRFTFHDREVLQRLHVDDILVFSRANGRIQVERRPPGSMGQQRFGSTAG